MSRWHCIITSIVVEHGQYVCLAYEKVWRYRVKRQKQIAACLSSIRRLVASRKVPFAFFVEMSLLRSSIQRTCIKNKRGPDETWRQFCFDLHQQYRLANRLYWRPMSKISLHPQGNQYNLPCAILGKNFGSSLRSTFGSWRRSKVSYPFRGQKQSVRLIMFGQVWCHQWRAFDLSPAFRTFSPLALHGRELSERVGSPSFEAHFGAATPYSNQGVRPKYSQTLWACS